MHDTYDPRNEINKFVATSPELLGKECVSCRRILEFCFFRKDSSSQDGHVHMCDQCEATPRLSISEHTARMNEMNFNSEAVKKQRWEGQLDFMNDEARQGRWMHHSEFLSHLAKIAKDLYITEGRIEGDLAVFRTFGKPQPELEGRTFQYLFYVPTGWMPEASLIEFNSMAVPVKERKRGWRTPLLRLIKSGIITEEQCRQEFGEPTPGADTVWNRELKKYRQTKGKGDLE